MRSDNMRDWPDALWGAIFIFLACAVAVIALYSRSTNAASVVTLGTSIVTGAFGFITGKTAGKNSVQVPLDTQTDANTKTTVETTTAPKP